MNKISSRSTFFYKRIFPILWFGFIAVFMCVGIGGGIQRRNFDELVPFVIVPIFMAAVGYLVMKWLIFDLVDEVWDADTELVVRNGGREERIALADIMNVSYSGHANPPRITLMLRQPSEFGTEISFTPPFRVFPFSTPPIARDLIARIDEARRHNNR